MNLRQRLLDWMRGGDGDFAETSLEVFAHQFQQNLPYRNYCEALGKSPENVTTWQEIPAVPTDVFKIPDIPLRCFPSEEIAGHFLTSGTTAEIKGKHEFRSLELYEASAMGTWREMKLPPLDQTFLFSQSPTTATHSSLIRMFHMLAPNGTYLIDNNGNFTLEKFTPTQPAAILGTSIAILKACDEMPALTLPEGSWIFETGGSKGLKKSFTPAEVRQRLSAHFGIPESRILNEYGMTELFSQFYKWGDEETHKAPPWTAIRILDVFTGQPAAQGTPGYLEIIDLANLDTVSAIRTQDIAIAHNDREFTLLGRDPNAIARGCSRAIQ
ncbi:MAG: hypothetical protein NWT08_05675 [Akkermansiaceae bacterium]|nr:hypothetical protein [Akkermansiaceae bacterium]MDP4645738.1 hypothetical protein [Akkermansiaceae bacterium]MDP4720580.1 hypothetical protein [Akkermansiaceae bacterium]MDP4781495.1 hypothetical protein [Akkermansiaceae bacterium]MDP4847598.1 hypothetical protein [Akkermansiaceae bacterium]